MKTMLRLLITALFVAGCSGLIYLSMDNERLAGDVRRLEAELGKLTVTDSKSVHLVEIAKPEVPPEVARHVPRVWQFRCYLPPNYDFARMNGSGRVSQEGVYHRGGFSSGWGMPSASEAHELLTISIRRQDKRLEVFYSFGSGSGTTSWNEIDPNRLDQMVVQKLVSAGSGPRTFSQDTILPLLKIFDPDSAQEEKVDDQVLTTYAGGMVVIYPKIRQADFDLLRVGKSPLEFNDQWLAKPVSDE